MKKLVLVAAMLMLSVMAFGAIGTGAWFTDSAQIQNVSLTASSLNITAVPFASMGTSALEPGGAPKSAGIVDVTNAGDIDMKYRAWFADVIDSAGMGAYLRVTVVQNPSSHPGNIGSINATLCSAEPFNNLTVAGNACLTEAGPIATGQWVSYEFLVTLDSAAPNSVQGATVVANLDYYATQFINPGW